MTAPYYSDGTVTLWHGDCLDVLRDMPDASVDSVVTDPPYGLGFMGKEWDAFGGVAGITDPDIRAAQQEKWGTKFGASARPAAPAAGEMAAFQSWCHAWAIECLRVLKPGGHLLAFGGTRTNHRLACAIEDAGFEIRDSIAWLYGSGFPKSLNVGRAVDRRLCPAHSDDPDHECPAAPEADPWRGHGTAMKPAHEPVVVARKPLTGTVAANVLTWGTGALNVDGCRIGADSTRRTQRGTTQAWEGGAFSGDRVNGSDAGRWPANVVLDEAQAAALDQQSGETSSPSSYVRRTTNKLNIYGQGIGESAGALSQNFGDTGGASRFFYTAKADTRERIRLDDTAHPTVKPLTLIRWLIRLVTPLTERPGVVLDPFAGSGTTAEACILEGFRCITIEKEADYLPLIVQRVNRQRDPIAYTRTAGEDLGLFGLGPEGT